jgi:hypothetical protein
MKIVLLLGIVKGEDIHIDPPHLVVGPHLAEVDLRGTVTCGP